MPSFFWSAWSPLLFVSGQLVLSQYSGDSANGLNLLLSLGDWHILKGKLLYSLPISSIAKKYQTKENQGKHKEK